MARPVALCWARAGRAHAAPRPCATYRADDRNADLIYAALATLRGCNYLRCTVTLTEEWSTEHHQSVASLSLLLQYDGPQNSNAVASPSVSVESVSSDQLHLTLNH